MLSGRKNSICTSFAHNLDPCEPNRDMAPSTGSDDGPVDARYYDQDQIVRMFEIDICAW